MENLSLYQKILESNLINFIIMISILVFIFKKAKLGIFIDKMAENIKNSVNSSAKAAKNALDEYKMARKEARKAPNLKAGIIQNAKETSQNMIKNAQISLENETNILDKKCEEQIKNNIQKTKEKTANEIFSAAIMLAEQEIKKMLSSDMQQKLIQNSIDEIDNLEDIKV